MKVSKAESTYCQEFGNYLQKARLNAGYTQKEISDMCGFSRAQFISNIERGLCWPPMNVLLIMCDVYNIKREKMLTKLVHYRKKVWAEEMGLGSV